MQGEQQSKSVIFVVGMHRSGTSAVTRTINLLGAEVGSRLLETQHEINIDGFWEHQTVVDINQRILVENQTAWFDTRLLPENFENEESYKKQIAEFFSAELTGNLLVIKDPRLCLTISLWLEVASSLGYNTHIVYVYRHPCAVIQSLHARDPFTPLVYEFLWLKYLYLSARAVNSHGAYYLDYDSFVEDPLVFVSSLTSSFSLPDWDSDIDLNEITNLVSSSKRRNVFSDFKQASEENRDALEAAYQELKSINNHCEVNLLTDFIDSGFGRFARELSNNAVFHQALFETNLVLRNQAHQLTDISSDFQQAQALILEKSNTVNEQLKQLQLFGEKLTSASEELEQQQAKSESLVVELADMGDKVSSFESKVEELTNRLDELEKVEADLELLQHQLSEKESALADRDSRLEASLLELEKIREALKISDSRVEALELSLEQHKQSVMTSEQKLVRSKKRYYDLESQYQQAIETLRLKEEESYQQQQRSEQEKIELGRQIALEKQRVLQLEQELHLAGERLQVKDSQLKVINDQLLEWSASRKIAKIRMKMIEARKQCMALEEEKKRLHHQLLENDRQRIDTAEATEAATEARLDVQKQQKTSVSPATEKWHGSGTGR